MKYSSGVARFDVYGDDETVDVPFGKPWPSTPVIVIDRADGFTFAIRSLSVDGMTVKAWRHGERTECLMHWHAMSASKG